MAQAVQRRRGTTAQHAAFTGLLGEVTIDTTKKVVVVHDGATSGGFPMAPENHGHAAVGANTAGFVPAPGTASGRVFTDTSGGSWQAFSAPPAISVGDANKDVSVNAVGTALEYVTADVARARKYAAPADVLAALNMVRNPSGSVSRVNGTSAVATTADADSKSGPDLWTLAQSGTMRATVQQVTDAPPGYANSVKVAITTAQASLSAGNFLTIGTTVQGVDAARLQFGLGTAKTAILPMWVKASVAGTYSVAVRNPALTRSFIGQIAIAATSTWEFKLVALTAQTGGVWPTDSGAGLTISIALAAGSNFVGSAGWNSANVIAQTGQTSLAATNAATFQIAGLGLIAGNDVLVSADAWRAQRVYAEELQMCAATDVVVRADVVQSLTDPQKAQAFTNLGTGPVGAVIDRKVATYTAYTAVGQIPLDTTAPQNTEGTQIFAETYTPKSATNKLRIRFTGCGGQSNSGDDMMIAALFVDSEASARRAVGAYARQYYQAIAVLEDEFVAGTTSAMTIKIRIGSYAASTMYVNGSAATGNFGGTQSLRLEIEEIKA